jgi:hypothetical protein
MSFLSQAPPLGGLLPPHGAFQEHAAHTLEWSRVLSSKGSLGTCIPRGLLTFLHAAFTAHYSVALACRSASAWRQQAQYSHYAPTATCKQASRRQKGADPQQAGL